MRIFVTGFGPFGRIRRNPSATLARRSGQPYAILPVTFAAVEEFVCHQYQAGHFDALLMMGVAQKRQHMSLETTAQNICGATRDVAGILLNGPISDGGPPNLAATLWPEDLTLPNEMRKSDDAGDYLCNYALYRALQQHPHHRIGFLHIPPFSEISWQRQGQLLRWLLDQLRSGS